MRHGHPSGIFHLHLLRDINACFWKWWRIYFFFFCCCFQACDDVATVRIQPGGVYPSAGIFFPRQSAPANHLRSWLCACACFSPWVFFSPYKISLFPRIVGTLIDVRAQKAKCQEVCWVNSVFFFPGTFIVFLFCCFFFSLSILFLVWPREFRFFFATRPTVYLRTKLKSKSLWTEMEIYAL